MHSIASGKPPVGSSDLFFSLFVLIQYDALFGERVTPDQLGHGIIRKFTENGLELRYSFRLLCVNLDHFKEAPALLSGRSVFYWDEKLFGDTKNIVCGCMQQY